LKEGTSRDADDLALRMDARRILSLALRGVSRAEAGACYTGARS
jgi:hypothetical protein